MIVSLEKTLQHLSACKKSTSSFMFSLRHSKNIVTLLFSVLWTCLSPRIQCHTIMLFICRQRINFIPHAFMEILQRHANLFLVLWACLVTVTKMIVSTCRRLRCLSSMFVLKILHFKEAYNLIGWQHFGP